MLWRLRHFDWLKSDMIKASRSIGIGLFAATGATCPLPKNNHGAPSCAPKFKDTIPSLFDFEGFDSNDILDFNE
jgi:hypothetical protein